MIQNKFFVNFHFDKYYFSLYFYYCQNVDQKRPNSNFLKAFLKNPLYLSPKKAFYE